MKNWKKFPRVLLLLTLLSSLLAGLSAPILGKQSASAAPMGVPATNVVISEFRTRGTNGASDEFIELYNPTGSAISIGNWLVNVLTGTGTEATRVTITAGTNLLPGQYYLIANNTATTGYSGSVTPNQTYTTGIVDAGGIALFDTSGTKIDSVGLNTTYTIYTENAPLADLFTFTPDANRSYERYLGGTSDSCQDNGDNSTDFRLINPSNPQNSSSTTPSLCGVLVPTPTPTNTLPPTNTPLPTSTSIPGNVDLSVKGAVTVNNEKPNLGDSVVFNVTVSNLAGSSLATHIIVNDVMSAGLTYVSDNGGGAYNKNTGLWSIPSLAAGSSISLKITARVNTTGTLTNTASVVASSGQTDTDSSNNSDSVAVNAIGGNADLSLIQDYEKADPGVAGRVVITIRVENDGPTPATNVIVKADLPSGLTYVSDNSGGSYDKDTGLWSAGAISYTGISANDFKELELTAKIDATEAMTITTMTIEAEVWSADQPDTDSPHGDGSGEDYASEKVQAADLSITNSMDNVTPIVGTDVVFTIRVSNAGPDTATVTVKDKLPAGYSFLSYFSTQGTYDDVSGIWNVGSLAKNDTATLTLTATVVSTTASTFVNWAEVWESDLIDIDSVPGDRSQSSDDDASAPAADLRLEQSVSTNYPALNTNFIYTVTVTNDGTVGATGVQVKDKLPSGVTFKSSITDPASSSYVPSTGLWTIGTLANGASAKLIITAQIPAAGVRTNLAEVWKSNLPDPDSTPGNSSTTEDDDASTAIYFRPILINEVAWAGTTASPDDQWIELYNPGAVAVNISGWKLTGSNTTTPVNITLNGTIAAGGFFLLERDNNFTVSDITASQIYTGALLTTGETLTLSTGSHVIDTANLTGSTNAKNPWPAGKLVSPFPSMERVGNTADNDSVWVSNTGVTKNGLTANGGGIYGTPGKKNSTGVSPTPTPITVRPTAVPIVRPVINEFLARPGYDWNQDGKVDVFDEFIEIKNIGIVDVNLTGWLLDDEEDSGSEPFKIPSAILKPGQRAIFYGSQTNILLGDGGDTVRLINPNSKIYDAYTYSLVRLEDQSVCRLPDGGSGWYDDCVPTPNLTNSREGVVPSMPGGEVFESPTCDLPDTLPADFLFAECRGYGADVWYSFYWDKLGWQGDQPIRESLSKWESFVE